MAQIENLKFRVSTDLKDKWIAMCAKKNISQSAAIEAIIRFALDQSDMGQSMVLGQVRPTAELVRTALMGSGRQRRR